jgi:hypothetical protein
MIIIIQEIEEQEIVLVETYRLFCPTCNCDTDHTVDDIGDWEVYTCVDCGKIIQYRVR